MKKTITIEVDFGNNLTANEFWDAVKQLQEKLNANLDIKVKEPHPTK